MAFPIQALSDVTARDRGKVQLKWMDGGPTPKRSPCIPTKETKALKDLSSRQGGVAQQQQTPAQEKVQSSSSSQEQQHPFEQRVDIYQEKKLRRW